MMNTKSIEKILHAILVLVFVVGTNWVPAKIAVAATDVNPVITRPLSKNYQSETQQFSLTIRAYIDGFSQLVIRGDTAYWHHISAAAPGRHISSNEPTFVNGLEWYPAWPDVPNEENRDCNCDSSALSGIDPELPQNARFALNVIQARHSVSISQQPSPANNHTLIIDFDDVPPSGADWYEVEVVIDQTNSFPWNIEFVSRLGGTAQVVAAMDSWVYLSVGPSVIVLDMSSPAQPRLAGRVTDLPDKPLEMQPTGRYLYTASGNAGLWVIDVGDPAHPVPVGQFKTAGFARSLVIGESFAYVGSDSGLQILDISTPISPTEVAYLPMTHGASSVKVSGQYVFITTGCELRIIDVSTPTLPVEVGTYRACIGRIAVTGTYAYAQVWDGQSLNTFRVLDVSNPSNPIEVASFDAQDTIMDLVVQGQYLYVSLRSNLVKVVNISNPLLPTWVATLDPGGRFRFIHRMAAVETVEKGANLP